MPLFYIERLWGGKEWFNKEFNINAGYSGLKFRVLSTFKVEVYIYPARRDKWGVTKIFLTMKKNSSRLTYEPGKKIEVENPTPEIWKFVRKEQNFYWTHRLVKLILMLTGVLTYRIWETKMKELLELILDLTK